MVMLVGFNITERTIDRHALENDLLLFAQQWVPFHVGCLFCMGAYKCDAVVVIKMGAYIHGVLIFYGCLLPQFYGSPKTLPH